MVKEKVLQAYADGSDINYIAECFSITEEEVKNILLAYKEESKYKRTFTDEFKIMIAERDMRKIARSTIAKELEINVATVKKACEKFGNAIKEVANNDNVYTLVEGVRNLETCPSCKSKKINSIESISDSINTSGIFCLDCGDEHFMMHKYTEEEVEETKEDGTVEKVMKKVPVDEKMYVYKVNFEYFEE